MKTENKIQWELCLCFQWEQRPVPAESKVLAELLCEHTSVQQLWFWRKQHSSKEGLNLIYVHHFHFCPEMMMVSWDDDVPQESQPFSPSRVPDCFCGCCFTRQVCSHRFMTLTKPRVFFKKKEKNLLNFFKFSFLLVAGNTSVRIWAHSCINLGCLSPMLYHEGHPHAYYKGCATLRRATLWWHGRSDFRSLLVF